MVCGCFLAFGSLYVSVVWYVGVEFGCNVACVCGGVCG